MPKEIERKFIVKDRSILQGKKGELVRQGYLSCIPERVVRIRVRGNCGYITIKGKTCNATRDEYEYAIPVSEANEMLDHLCIHPILEKKRYEVLFCDKIWEIDEFYGENNGLCIAEIELDAEEENVEIPQWADMEVTGDNRYYNANLVHFPFSKWNE